jgi:hypothetical protein
LTSDSAKNILDIIGGSAEDKIMAEIEEKSFIFEETESFSASDKYFFKRIREKATFLVV